MTYEIFTQTLAVTALIIWIYMTLWYIAAMLLKRNDIVDIAWGIGFIVVALITAGLYGDNTIRQWIIAIIVTAWGVRLALHILARFSLKKPEDFRYAHWRAQWGKTMWWRSYLQIYLLQGLFMLLVSAPIWILNTADDGSTGTLWLAFFGLFVWICGFYFEAVGDWQLAQFIKQKKAGTAAGTIMRTGLWQYTRHPNYFGEVTQWWGVWIVALLPALPISWIAIIGPVTISFLILKVSGIPMLEKKWADNPEFQEYAKHTSAFFPQPPTKK